VRRAILLRHSGSFEKVQVSLRGAPFLRKQNEPPAPRRQLEVRFNFLVIHNDVWGL
jgi:hypothetical protein